MDEVRGRRGSVRMGERRAGYRTGAFEKGE